jgi:hypothetical protein
MRARLLRLLSREDGISLVMAVGILGVLSVTGTTLIYYGGTNARSAAFSKENGVAYDIAEAGVNEMTAILWNGDNNPHNPYLLGARPDGTVVTKTTTYGGGTATWSGTLDQTVSPNVWTLRSVGRVANPTGATEQVTRTASVKVAVVPRTTQPLSNQVWNYFYVYGTGDPSGCDYLQANNSAMTSPLYVSGNACFENQAWVNIGPMYVHGTLSLKGPQNKVGESTSNPITRPVHIKGGCKRSGGNSFHIPCDATDAVYTSPAPAGTNPITLETPTPAWEEWYLNASPGPYYACRSTAGTAPNGNWATLFDNDQGSALTPDASHANRSAGTVTLTPGSSYSCKTAAGEISWNATSADSSTFGPAKTLTLWGTVFIDGNARIDSGSYVKTRGMGALFLSGSFVLKNTSVCNVVSGINCYWTLNQPSSWNPNENFFEIVAGWKGGGGQADISTSDVTVQFISAQFQGGMQSAGRVDVATSSSTQGPLVMSKVTLAQSLNTYPFPTLENVPVATPGNEPAYSMPQPPKDFGG